MALAAEKQFVETLKRCDHALITFRKDWSVDAAASALALRQYLTARGKQADIIVDGFEPSKAAKFLPGVTEIRPSLERLQKFIISLDVSRTRIDELSYDLKDDKLRIFVTPKAGQFAAQDLTTAASDFKYDLIITVDTPDYHALGSLFGLNTDFFYHRPTINIDHDPANEHYGNLNAVDITATSTAEIIFSLLRGAGEHFLEPDTATCLLAGMISKTRSFKTPTVTPKTLEIASELIAAGARRDEIVQHLYRTRSLATLKLWGRALARLKYDAAAKFAWTLLVRPDFIHAGAGEEFLPDVIEELMMNSPEAEIFGVLYEQEAPADRSRPSGICALVASEKYSDSLGLVSSLKPEGTRRLARLCFPAANLLDAEKAVLGSIYKSLGKPLPAESVQALAAQQAAAAAAPHAGLPAA